MPVYKPKALVAAGSLGELLRTIVVRSCKFLNKSYLFVFLLSLIPFLQIIFSPFLLFPLFLFSFFSYFYVISVFLSFFLSLSSFLSFLSALFSFFLGYKKGCYTHPTTTISVASLFVVLPWWLPKGYRLQSLQHKTLLTVDLASFAMRMFNRWGLARLSHFILPSTPTTFVASAGVESRCGRRSRRQVQQVPWVQ